MRNNKIRKMLIAVMMMSASFLLFSCADADGLHDQRAVKVTFIFQNFGDGIDGAYAIPGNFNDWDNKKSDITLKKGEGTSVQIPITVANIQFTLVPVNAWNRPWFIEDECEGNGSDSGVMRNFYIDGLDLNAGEITLVIDASSGTATPVAK